MRFHGKIAGGPRGCEVCGAQYVPQYRDQRTCGRTCGMALRRMVTGTLFRASYTRVAYGCCAVCGRTWAEPGQRAAAACGEHQTEWARQQQAERTTRYKAAARARWREQHPLPPPHPCAWCGEETERPRFCSERCSGRFAQAKRDRKNGRFKPTVYQRRRVYERDEYVCHLCDQPVRRGVPDDHPWSASLDHIVPRSEGGSDAVDNLATAHRWCNTLRRDGSILREPGRYIPETWEDFRAVHRGRVLAALGSRPRKRRRHADQFALF